MWGSPREIPESLKIGIRHDMLPTVLVAGYTGVVLSHLVCLGLEMAWNAARSHDVSI
jgi:hypothetical protein